MLFSEVPFLNHFMSNYKGSGSYCSESLLNAICAMGCNLLHDSDSKPSLHSGISDRNELQTAFLQEARNHMNADALTSLPTVQAFAVIFLVEMSAGRARIASSYLRYAAESLPAEVQGPYDRDTWEVSRWGIHTLNTYVHASAFVYLD